MTTELDDAATAHPSSGEAPLFSRQASATQHILRLLHLPARLGAAADAFRVSQQDSREFRRTWTTEAMSLLGASACWATGLALLVTGAAPIAFVPWMIAGTVESIAYLIILRGHASYVTTVLLPLIMLTSWAMSFIGLNPPVTALTGVIAALLICAVTETLRRTLLMCLFGAVDLLTLYTLGEPSRGTIDAAESIGTAAMAVCIAVIAIIGGWVWQVMHDETLRALNHNRALAKRLGQANVYLEQANTELATVNTHLESANGELAAANALLEERVAERTRELQELSVRDELTGLYNRRHFMHRLADPDIVTAPTSLLMVDIDHFKQINDTGGHAVGDEVLRRIAEVLGAQLRASDVLARIGGEEFAILLPHTPGAACAALAERLRSAVEAIAWDDLAVPGGRTTISIGVVTSEPGTDALSIETAELLNAADRALYSSKASGRNRVCTVAFEHSFPANPLGAES